MKKKNSFSDSGRWEKAAISMLLCVSLFAGLGVSANAENNLIRSTKSDGGVIAVDSSLKDRLDECNTVYNSYQNVKSSRVAKKPDSFTCVYSINGKIKQIDVKAECKVDKDSRNSMYIVYDDLSVNYYYSDKGYPRFALITDKTGVYDKEYRFWLSQGEVIKWIDDDGEEYYEEPVNFGDLYDIAMANYSRAMYDCYDKGKYLVQVGSFSDKEDAEKCVESMQELGEKMLVCEMDKAYCVVSEHYYEDWYSAAEYAEDMQFSEDCGSIYIRLYN